MVLAGEASYALYLTHVLVQPLVASATGWAAGSPVRSLVALVAIVGGLAGIAWVVHTRVEQPARRWLQRVGGPRSRRQADRPVEPWGEGGAEPRAEVQAPREGLVRVPV
jgi:peptidoglycan/LPS O-acetylase OafA/YrhL